MTVVICCAKKRLKKTRGSKNIVEVIENKKNNIKVIKTYSSIDETFVNKMMMEVNPNKLIVLDDVEIRGKRYTPTIEDILSSLKEESDIDIVYVFGVADKDSIKARVKFLIENGIYSIQRGFISSDELTKLLKNGMTKEEAVKMYEDTYNEHLDGTPIATTAENIEIKNDDKDAEKDDPLDFPFLKEYEDDSWNEYNYSKEDYVKPKPEIETIEAWEAENAEKVHCIACGKPLRNGAKFCHHCGARQDEHEETSEKEFDEAEILASLDDELVIEPIADDEETDDFFEDAKEIFESEEEETLHHSTSVNDIENPEDDSKTKEILEKFSESEETDSNTQIIEASFNSDKKENKRRSSFVDLEDYDERNTRIIGCATIGIAQLKSRTGSTHISVEIANMLYKEGFDVGICLLDDAEYENLKKYLVVDKDYENYFVYDGLRYYRSNAYYYAQGEHEIMVNDCGILEDERIENEYERMKIKIMLCDPAPWNMQLFHNYIMNPTKPYHRTIYYLVNLISRTRFDAIFGQLEREEYKFYPLAANDNVFEPLKENQEVYHRVLKSIIGERRLTRHKRRGFLSLPFGGKN